MQALRLPAFRGLHPAARCCMMVPMETTTEHSPMREARENKGWTLRKLAAVITASGVSVSDGNLSRIERGEISPRPGLKRAIADALSLELSQLP